MKELEVQSMKRSERDVQEQLTNYYRSIGYTVQREVKTPLGYIDLLCTTSIEVDCKVADTNLLVGSEATSNLLIEVKEYHSIKHAVGQLYAYSKYYPNYTLVLAYFSYKGLPPALHPTNYTFDNITLVNAHSVLVPQSTNQAHSCSEYSLVPDYYLPLEPLENTNYQHIKW